MRTDHWWARWSHPEHEWKRAADDSLRRSQFRRNLDTRRPYWIRVGVCALFVVAFATSIALLLLAHGWRTFF